MNRRKKEKDEHRFYSSVHFCGFFFLLDVFGFSRNYYHRNFFIDVLYYHYSLIDTENFYYSNFFIYINLEDFVVVNVYVLSFFINYLRIL